MRRTWFLLLTALAAGCGGDAAQAPAGAAGMLSLERENGGRLLESVPRVLACRRDTTVALVAVGRDWAGAISLRTLLPAESTQTLNVQDRLLLPGSAVLALRTMDDSLHAWAGYAGTVQLEAGTTVAGSFAASVRRDTMTMRVTGRFSAPMPRDACP